MSDQKNNLILINKPENISSFKALGAVKRAVGTRKVGHTGTLDPFASGLMVVLTGKYTRLASYFEAGTKRYTAVLKFGELTDTLDLEGEILRTGGTIPSKKIVLQKIQEFTGEITQIPPIYSAVKINGKRAYEYARKGEIVKTKPRQVNILSLKLVDYDNVKGAASLDVICSKGTYIRTLASDLAISCGSFGHLISLTRTEVGGFSVEQAVEPEKLSENDFYKITPQLLEQYTSLKAVNVGENIIDFVRYGKKLKPEMSGLENCEDGDIALFYNEEIAAVVVKKESEFFYKGVYLDL
jgi:tRNA pseudouridine55 synthase